MQVTYCVFFCWCISVAAFGQTQRAPIVVSRSLVAFSSVSEQPQVAPDGNGGVYVVFRSTREGTRFGQLFAQHLSKDGTRLWGPRGKAISTDSLVHLRPQVLPGGNGGLLVVWEARTPGSGTHPEAYAQRLDAQGKRLWGDPVQLATSRQLKRGLQLIADGSGGLYAVWEAVQSEATSHIVAQRLGPDGKRLWGDFGVPVVAYPGKRRTPLLARSPGYGLAVAWDDYRSGRWVLYGMVLDEAGRHQWPEGGQSFELPGISELPSRPALIADGFGGMVLVYGSTAAGKVEDDLVALRFSRSGHYRYHTVIAGGAGHQQHPTVLRLAGEAWVVWEDTRLGSRDLFSARFSIEDGQLTAQPTPLARSGGAQQTPTTFLGYPLTGFTAVWQEQSGGQYAFRAQRLEGDAPMWGYQGEVLLTPEHRTTLAACGDVYGGMWYTWITPEGNPVLQRLNEKGQCQFSTTGVSALEPSGAVAARLARPVIVKGLDRDSYVAVEDFRAGLDKPAIYLQRLDGEGSPLWPDGGIRVAKQPGVQELPRLVALSGGVCVGWTHRLANGDENLYVQFLDSTGKLLGPSGGYRLCAAPRSQNSLRLARIGSNNHVLAVWTDARNFRTNGFDIYYQRLDSQGNLHLGQDGAPLGPTAEYQVSPALLEDGDEGVYVVWMDQQTGVYQLLGQRISPTTDLLWPKEGIRVGPGTENQRYPALAQVGKTLFVSWSEDRPRSNQSRVVVQALTPSGGYYWGRTPRPVTLTYGSQTVPQLAGSPDGVMVGWLDQRNEARSGFNLFAARVQLAGTVNWPSGGVNLGKFLPEYGEMALSLRPDGRFAYCLWSERSTDRAIVQYARLGFTTGRLVWRQRATPSPHAQLFPRMTLLGNGKLAALWVNQASDDSAAELMLWPLD